MNDCQKLLELLSQWVDGELERGISEELKLHVRVCNRCACFYATFTRTIQWCRLIEYEDVPEDVHDSVWDIIRRTCFDEDELP